MSETTVQDLVTQAVENNPAKISDTFNDLVLQRVVDAVSQRKQEIAQTLFDEPEEDDQEDISDEDIDVSDEELEQLDTEDDDEDTETDA